MTEIKKGMSELLKTWWLGYLSGVINGISMRGDIPPDVRKTCEDIIIRYKTELDNILEVKNDKTRSVKKVA